jgi:hypothetical protein
MLFIYTCSGTFVNNFLGGFEFVEVCAQTNSAKRQYNNYNSYRPC